MSMTDMTSQLSSLLLVSCHREACPYGMFHVPGFCVFCNPPLKFYFFRLS